MFFFFFFESRELTGFGSSTARPRKRPPETTLKRKVRWFWEGGGQQKAFDTPSASASSRIGIIGFKLIFWDTPLPCRNIPAYKNLRSLSGSGLKIFL